MAEEVAGQLLSRIPEIIKNEPGVRPSEINRRLGLAQFHRTGAGAATAWATDLWSPAVALAAVLSHAVSICTLRLSGPVITTYCAMPKK